MARPVKSSGQLQEGEQGEVEVALYGVDQLPVGLSPGRPTLADYEDMIRKEEEEEEEEEEDSEEGERGRLVQSDGMSRMQRKKQQQRLVYAVNYGTSTGALDNASPRSILKSQKRKQQRLKELVEAEEGETLSRSVSWADLHASLPLTAVKAIPKGGEAREARRSVPTEYMTMRRNEREAQRHRSVMVFCSALICAVILLIFGLVAIVLLAGG